MKLYYRKIKHKWKYQTASVFTIGLLGLKFGNDIENYFVRLYRSDFLLIKAGYAWDGPSGPTLDTKDFMRGSLVHDVLYQLMREGKLARSNRKRADEILKEICIEDGMPKWRAAYVYWAVRVFGKKYAMRSKKREKIYSVGI